MGIAMSLKEEMNQLVKTISSDDNAQFFPDGYVERILSTISKHLPEKKRKMSYVEVVKDFKLMEIATQNHGFNMAIDEVNKLLTTNKKEEV